MKEKSPYKSLGEWRKANPKEYKKAYSKGWLDEICGKFSWIKISKKINANGYWNIKERVLNESKKYKTRSEWQKNSSGSYNSARKNGWLDECTEHMKRFNKPNKYWVKKKCITEAKKYKTRSEWAKNSSGSYNSAKINGWLDECTKHMIEVLKPKGYWTKELCLVEAKKYKTRNEWQKNSQTSYNKSRMNGWYDECILHMEIKKIPSTYWTKELCLVEAKKYNSKSKWKKNNSSSYNSARINGWFNECTKHMKRGRKISI